MIPTRCFLLAMLCRYVILRVGPFILQNTVHAAISDSVPPESNTTPNLASSPSLSPGLCCRMLQNWLQTGGAPMQNHALNQRVDAEWLS